MTKQAVKAEDLKVGDMLFSSPVAGRVLSLAPYPRFAEICPGYSARIARLDNGRDMTVVDGGTYDIAA
jgi:hypothetical protein